MAKSDARIAVMEYGMNQAEVVWPVTLTVAEGRAPLVDAEMKERERKSC